MQATTTAARRSPLKRLAEASTITCAESAGLYGKCIAARYTDISKDACKAEFTTFIQCVQKAVGQELLTMAHN